MSPLINVTTVLKNHREKGTIQSKRVCGKGGLLHCQETITPTANLDEK